MRIYTADNTPLDFCDRCTPTEDAAFEKYGKGEGPDGRGNCFAYDAEHPDYEDGSFYCAKCGERLVVMPSSWVVRCFGFVEG